MKLSLTYIFLILLNFSAKTQGLQYGSIHGIVYNSDSTEVIPFAIVILEFNEEDIALRTDFDGYYKFDSVKTGLYKIKVKSALNGSTEIQKITVDNLKATVVNVFLQGLIITCNGGGCCWPPAHGYMRGEEQIIKIKSQDLKINPGTYRIDRVVDFQTNEYNEMRVRGSRNGDVIYIVDGIRTRNKPNLPNCSINEIQYYLGGVPAKYGDATGGVIIIQTTGYFDLYYAWLASQ